MNKEKNSSQKAIAQHSTKPDIKRDVGKGTKGGKGLGGKGPRKATPQGRNLKSHGPNGGKSANGGRGLRKATPQGRNLKSHGPNGGRVHNGRRGAAENVNNRTNNAGTSRPHRGGRD